MSVCIAARFSAIDRRTEEQRRENILELLARMVILFLGVFMRYRADKVQAS